jgi:serine/threonine-protein kinase
MTLEGRLAGILQGTDKPGAGDCIDAGELCFVRNHYAAAARLYAVALAAEPGLTEDMRAGRRFNAACAAALAGCGRGDDAADLSESERARQRQQAREWLSLDLLEWTRKLKSTDSQDRFDVHEALTRWRRDPDLAGLRDSPALDSLTPTEQSECRALWAEVDARLSAARPAR